MPCCGQKRALLRTPLAPTTTVMQPAPNSFPPAHTTQTPPPSRGSSSSSVAVRYLETSPILVRGPVTGQAYEFSSTRPVQIVDSRDAAALLRTRFFRPA